MANEKPRWLVAVQVTGHEETRISPNSGKPYTQAEAYASLPGSLYPQRFKFYCATPKEVPHPGFYECEVTFSIRNENLDFRCDPRQGRRLPDPVKSSGAHA